MIKDNIETKTKNDIKWKENYMLLRKFKQEFGRFPKKGENYKGVNLGKWCNRQRQVYKGNRNGNLSKERIELLESIGFQWDPFEERWMKNFELLKEFKEEFNRFPYQKEVYKEVGIGEWCSTQRKVYKKQKEGNLTQEKIKLLESIGFI